MVRERGDKPGDRLAVQCTPELRQTGRQLIGDFRIGIEVEGLGLLVIA